MKKIIHILKITFNKDYRNKVELQSYRNRNWAHIKQTIGIDR